MEANKLDAEKCIRLAVQFAYQGDYEKAVRFVEKSVKLYPTEQAQQMLSDYQTRLAADSSKSTQEDSNRIYESKMNLNEDEKVSGGRVGEDDGAEASQKTMGEQIRRISCCRCFYEILGVPRSASDSELRRAYKRLALQFHPDKNQLPGATDCFKAIGKAFAVLSDTKKRKDYDIYGPEMFEAPMSGGGATRHANLRRGSFSNAAYSRKGANGTAQSSRPNSRTTFYYWSEDDFSADELFNLFFGNYSNNTADQTTSQSTTNLSGSREGLNRRSQRGNRTNSRTNNSNFVFTSNNYAILFQFMPIILIILLSLFSNLLVGEPYYSLQKTNKYIVKRTTSHYQIPYFVKPNFSMETESELDGMERQIEENVRQELKQACFKEKHFKETAMWRAQKVDDERLMRKANDYETPACDKLRTIFGMAIS